MDRLIEFARDLRRESTPAERLLWSRLRSRQLGFRFRRQHPVAGFILDFYCPRARLAVELDGGGHASPNQRRRDQRRDRTLARHGIRVLRFWNPDVVSDLDAVLEMIEHGVTEAATTG